MWKDVWNDMFNGGSMWAGVINGGYSQLRDTVKLKTGQITAADYGVHTTRNVTSAIGTMAGVEAGAVLGSLVMPGFGTMLGSVIGGLVGDRVGCYTGDQAGTLLFKQHQKHGAPDMAH